MKKSFLMAAMLVVSALSVQAAAIQATCARVNNFSDVLALNETGGCQVGDKIFSNFNTPSTNGIPDPTIGGIPANWQVTLERLPSGEYNVDFAQGSTGSQLSFPRGPWFVSYDVRVDTAFPGAADKYITEVGINLNAGATGRGTLSKAITNLDPSLPVGIGALLGSGSTSGGNGYIISLLPASQWIHVVETITLTRGTLSSFTDAYIQSPEPATYGMMGLGLAALGLIARRKKT
jgi:hypothetical protein